MSYETPENLNYNKEHEWLSQEDGVVKIGVTDYAQKMLKDVVFIELPDVGDTFTFGEVFGSIESVKAVNDLFSPVSGKVIEVNEAVMEAPETVNENPYEAWLLIVKPQNLEEDLSKLMSAAEYSDYCSGL